MLITWPRSRSAEEYYGSRAAYLVSSAAHLTAAVYVFSSMYCILLGDMAVARLEDIRDDCDTLLALHADGVR